ncbi:NAD(P)-dependent oxidoreductase [Elioraea rosea]|uniref:NAD(P)-dependent oxidoreductase n=1 Tax=Elioraea rosea TaxID=2492390 RepID=UPI0011839223|nr:NAD(P)-dependent oxidoreductase [Elioraea rosea]
MSTKPRVGYIGVGLMGHGAAKHILRNGYPLTILGHRNRAPVDDLLTRGATEAHTPSEMARTSDIVFLCLPSAAEVEATVLGPAGLLEGFSSGATLVDSTSSDPALTRRLGTILAERGVEMVDAPVGRTPREAEEGKLSTFLGGSPDAVARVKPIIASYADTIIEAGPLGAGHTLKLVNNFISIGTSAVISEAVATASRLGVDLRKLYEVVSAGGANSAMFQMMMPWVLEGDDSRLKGPIRIAAKDMRTYCRMAEAAPAPSFVAQACSQVWQMALAQGHGERFMPVLPEIVARLSRGHIRDLPD